MDFSESTKIVSSRIQQIEPDHASKIVGYLLLQVCGDQDMIRLAFSPDNVIKSVADKVKLILGLSSPKQQLIYAPISNQSNNPTHISDLSIPFNPFQAPSHSRGFSLSLPTLNACWNTQVYSEPVPSSYGLENQFQQVLSLDTNLDSGSVMESEIYGNCYYPEPGLDELSVGRFNRRSQSCSEFSPKVCHYFSKGFCKHGSNCKYLHDPKSFLQSLDFGYNENGHGNGNGNGNGNDDLNVLPVRSLEQLQVDVIELLRSRKGGPVSIASLPMLYHEKYGRTLQAEGYLTESQRHGKVGYSLTKLLSRLNGIYLIDRPHGQHSVILAEDAHKYFEYGSDRNELGGIVPGSRQIYLTFPAESTFTENDVSNYFNTYGPVQDVRIPFQQKRMFGFVTFVYQETVRKILAKGNPHFVCGSRVLVKPYREKSRLGDRKHAEKLQHSMHTSSQLDGEYDVHSLPKACDGSRFMMQRFMEEHREALELEKRRLSESQELPKASAGLHCFDNSMNMLKLSTEFPTLKQFNFGVNLLNNGSPTEEKLRNVTTNCNDQESNQGLNLPDNPFATSVANSITT